MKYMHDFLQHHGIKGQQWGVRRFQNEDGTLTPEGRERYLKNFNKQADIYNKAVDKMNPQLEKINKKYDNVDLDNDENNLTYTKEIRDFWQKAYREEVAKDLGTDPKTLEGQKWLEEMFGYTAMDKEVEELEKKINEKKEKEGAQSSTAKVDVNKIKLPKTVDADYSSKKMTQEKAIDQAYNDLEKLFPDFDSFPLDKQDELFFDYLNKSGLYKWT